MVNIMKVKHTFAYYLPQFHEIEENNKWWGKGFTEWTNVRNAVQYGKKQEIRYPSELGYYILDHAEIMEKQYSLAIEHNIDTFCFWHYWFDDEQTILEKPIDLLLESKVNVNFCFAWANHTWMNKTKNITLKEQKYNFDLERYFKYLLKYFKDSRYRKIDNKPVFFIYDAKNAPNYFNLKETFTSLAIEAGFDGMFFILENCNEVDFEILGGDAFLNSGKFLAFRGVIHKARDRIYYNLGKFSFKVPRFYKYESCVKYMNSDISKTGKEIPVIFPGWDSTIRHKKGGVCFYGTSPDTFEINLQSAYDVLKERSIDDRILVIKSWNEWAEGNFIEPCNIYGRSYLERFAKYFKSSI
ncbi:Glycosyltransferase WbsX family protein [Vibrio parahaemolyticus]